MQSIQYQNQNSVQSNIAILAIGLTILTATIHLFNANEAMGDATYKGILFISNGLGAIVAAIGIARDEKTWGWNLAALIALGSSLAYIASRTQNAPSGGVAARHDHCDATTQHLGFSRFEPFLARPTRVSTRATHS